MNIQPVLLQGRAVRLEPLGLGHVSALCDVGLDPELWRLTMTQIRTPEEMRAYVAEALRLQSLGSALPFAIIEQATGRAVGSTRYANIEEVHRRLEIGWTWVAGPWQRTIVNTEAKYLLLCHAFDVLGCNRVELKTDALNTRSRSAILRIGATEEGILRQHQIAPGGRFRDSVYFSILAQEWPGVKRALASKLGISQ
jgi:RimJ/RimL family protein N-acetyltransferase